MKISRIYNVSFACKCSLLVQNTHSFTWSVQAIPYYLDYDFSVKCPFKKFYAIHNTVWLNVKNS